MMFFHKAGLYYISMTMKRTRDKYFVFYNIEKVGL